MRKLGILCVATGLLLIAASAWQYVRESRRSPLPEAVLALERSLARSGLLGLCSLALGFFFLRGERGLLGALDALPVGGGGIFSRRFRPGRSRCCRRRRR